MTFDLTFDVTFDVTFVQQQDPLVRQNSTNKPRSLPSWLANIDTESKMPAKKRAKRGM